MKTGTLRRDGRIGWPLAALLAGGALAATSVDVRAEITPGMWKVGVASDTIPDGVAIPGSSECISEKQAKSPLDLIPVEHDAQCKFTRKDVVGNRVEWLADCMRTSTASNFKVTGHLELAAEAYEGHIKVEEEGADPRGFVIRAERIGDC